MLRMVYQGSVEQMHDHLWEAVRSGLIFRAKDSYRFLHRPRARSIGLADPRVAAALADDRVAFDRHRVARRVGEQQDAFGQKTAIAPAEEAHDVFDRRAFGSGCPCDKAPDVALSTMLPRNEGSVGAVPGPIAGWRSRRTRGRVRSSPGRVVRAALRYGTRAVVGRVGLI
jgi:hypothetical protein